MATLRTKVGFLPNLSDNHPLGSIRAVENKPAADRRKPTSRIEAPKL
jgi:hypothetical protein